MSPLPLGGIDYEDQLIDGVVGLFQSHHYLGDSTKVSVIRRGYPQDNDEPENLRSKDEMPAVLVQCDRTGNDDDPAVDMEALGHTITIDVVTVNGVTRDGRKDCGRIRSEAISALHRENGFSTLVASAAQLWIDKAETSSTKVDKGLGKNKHAFWCRTEVPVILNWCSTVAS